MTGVAISIMVKDPAHQGPCELFYYDIGDYQSREQKLASIEGFGSIEGMDWKRLKPNPEGDWINQRDPAFDRFIKLGDKKGSNDCIIFNCYSNGVQTNRDPWTYSFSKESVANNMARMIDAYNVEVAVWKAAIDQSSSQSIDKIVDHDPKKISWTRGLKDKARRGVRISFSGNKIRESMYRPFCAQWVYFDRTLNEYINQMPSYFPTEVHYNTAIYLTGTGSTKEFSALVLGLVPNLEMISKGQCFPLYWYEQASTASQDALTLGLDGATDTLDEHGYIRREAITDWALYKFRIHYQDQAITKEDLFWYVYGILHSPEYRNRFADNLKRMLPRIPLAGDFWAFSKAGRQLGQWHLGYETVDPYPLEEETKRLVMEPEDYRVSKMVFGKKDGKPDKSVIIYNQHLTLRGIPLEAYDYIVNGKSAIEWLVERYAVTKDKDSGITNNANDWSEDPMYIFNLVKRIVRVSIETVKIVKALPALNEIQRPFEALNLSQNLSPPPNAAMPSSSHRKRSRHLIN